MATSSSTVINQGWQPDVLGSGYEQLTLPDVHAAGLPEEHQSPAGTLVRHVPSTVVGADGVAERPVAILYLHGFVDYFFHPHVADALADAGYAFYAVDLRGYGRSQEAWVEAGGQPNMTYDIGEYAADLDAAAAAIRARGHQKLVVMAHSMGGLIATLWANGSAPHDSIRADALILNAPWFGLNENELLRGPGTAAISLLSRFAPEFEVGGIKPHYGKALHRETGGEWDFDLRWKPHEGFPVQAAWFSSIRRGHRQIDEGFVHLHIPVLVLASTRSGNSKQWHPEVITTDSVLDVYDIANGAARIGDDVTYIQIPGGAHDLALSREPARSEYLAAVLGWLSVKVPA